MSDYIYNIVKNDGDLSSATVTVLATADQYVATAEQDHFRRVVEALLANAPLDTVVGVFDIALGLNQGFAVYTDRVTVRDGKVYFDGDPADDIITETIVRFHNEGKSEDLLPLVKFLDNVAQNPNEHSRKHLSRWLTQRSFSLDQEGYIVAYKGVYDAGSGKPGVYRPSHNGPDVFVNGVPVESGKYAEQKVGDVVTMPRSKVEFDPKVACSRGLHVGTWSYAESFGPRTLLVRVNPRDVVSVPTDCSDQKMRACRYEIVAEGVNAEKSDLYVPINVPKPKPAPAPAPKPEPKVEEAAPTGGPNEQYISYRKSDFEALDVPTLSRIAKAWNVKPGFPRTKKAYVATVSKQAGNIRHNRNRGQGFQARGV